MTIIKQPKVGTELKPNASQTVAYIQLTVNCHDGHRFKTYTGISVPYEAPKKRRAKGTAPQVVDLISNEQNVNLKKQRHDLETIIENLFTSRLPITRERLQTKYNELTEQAEQKEIIAIKKALDPNRTLLYWLNNLPEKFITKPKGAIKSKETKGGYSTIALHITVFQEYLRIKTGKQLTIMLSDVDREFIEDFDKFLATKDVILTQEKYKHLIGFKFPNREVFRYNAIPLAPPSRRARIKGLIALLKFIRKDKGYEIGTFATQEERNRNLFDTYEYPADSRENVYLQHHLTEDEIEKIYALRNDKKILCKDNAKRWLLEIDRIVFNCWTGLRFKDSISWDETNLIADNSDSQKMRLVITTNKKKVLADIPIMGGALLVMESRKWKPLPPTNNFDANEWIGKICKMAGINQKVPTLKNPAEGQKQIFVPKYEALHVHSLRHTFANILHKRDVNDKDAILMTGHKKTEQFNTTYFSNDEVKRAKQHDSIRDKFGDVPQMKVVHRKMKKSA